MAMVRFAPSQETTDAACWQCGAPAAPECAYSMRLVGRARRELNPLGFAVKRGKLWDGVTVPVPRCRDCRSRTWFSWAIILASALAGAIVLPILSARLWPQATALNGLPADHEVGLNVMIFLGVGVGFGAAALGVASHRRLAGRRSVNSYPPIVRLRRHEGWRIPD
jgi:hypothetical protein